jgi:hypothetical protein
MPARHEKIGERAGDEQAVGVLLQPAIKKDSRVRQIGIGTVMLHTLWIRTPFGSEGFNDC